FRQLAFPLRIFLLILVVSVFIVAALAQYLSASFEDYLASHVRDMAMNQAKIIASNDSIIAAVKNRDYKRLAIIANKLQRGTDFDYVVIGDRDRHSIRLYDRRSPLDPALPSESGKNRLSHAVYETRRAGKRRKLFHYR
ncbi:Sensor kinase CitA, partial [Salmonella enterica subsp. enterica serovar Hvittingfoss str. A4-620]